MTIQAFAEIKEAFIKTITSSYTPPNVLTDQLLKPVPVEFGQLQCDIERNSHGMNKFWPKYTVSLGGNHIGLLSAKKLANSKTSHYRIELTDPNNKYQKADTEHYIGRVRANYSNHEFYIFDTGCNPADLKKQKSPEGVERRQYGTVIYAPDKFGDKNPRKMEVYLPMITCDNQNLMSWPDDELKKSNLYFEYNQQKLKKINLERQGKEIVNETSSPLIMQFKS